jgi:UDP-N-acetylglucosamine acyltransferase
MDGTHTVRGLNTVGLRRAGFDRERMRALRKAFSRLFRQKVNLKLAVAELRQEPCTPDVAYLLDFIEQSKRGVCFGPKNLRTGEESEE